MQFETTFCSVDLVCVHLGSSPCLAVLPATPSFVVTFYRQTLWSMTTTDRNACRRWRSHWSGPQLLFEQNHVYHRPWHRRSRLAISYNSGFRSFDEATLLFSAWLKLFQQKIKMQRDAAASSLGVPLASTHSHSAATNEWNTGVILMILPRCHHTHLKSRKQREAESECWALKLCPSLWS